MDFDILQKRSSMVIGMAWDAKISQKDRKVAKKFKNFSEKAKKIGKIAENACTRNDSNLNEVRIYKEIQKLKRNNMKKTLASLALIGAMSGVSLGAFELPELTLDVKGSFDSEYVYRGRKQGGQNFQLGFETGTELFGGHVYVGVWNAEMLQDHSMDLVKLDGSDVEKVSMSMNETSPYIGYSYGVSDTFMVDVGYIAHLYTNMKPWSSVFTDGGDDSVSADKKTGFARNTNEIYLGVAADVVMSPKLYFSYDFDREEFCLLGTAGYSYDLGQYGWSNFAIEAKGDFGYDYAKRPFGIKNYYNAYAKGVKTDGDSIHTDGALGTSKGYVFWGLGANVVYKYNEHAKFKAGVRYSGNAAGKNEWNNYFFGGHKNMCWFTSCVECSF